MTQARGFDLGYICFETWLGLQDHAKRPILIQAIAHCPLEPVERDCLNFVVHHSMEPFDLSTLFIDADDEYELEVVRRGEFTVHRACFLCLQFLWKMGEVKNEDIINCPCLTEITGLEEIDQLVKMLGEDFGSPQLQLELQLQLL